jgi:single-strand DNA-binding protein
MINTVILVGRVGQDPEIKYFESGSVKARFSVAVDRSFSRENKVTDWFNIEVWGRQAEFASEWIRKGTMVAITGQIEVQRWTDQSGNVRETLIVKAQDIRLVGSKRDNPATATAGSVGGGGYAGAGDVPF